MTTKHWLTDDFRPVSLRELESRASMLERLDNKYVLRASILEHALDALMREFEILEIDGKREFTYETMYFDDERRSSYFDHHQGRRRRCKVRVRKYIDAELCFVEVKLKDKRGITRKKRLAYPMQNYGRLDEQAIAHVQREYRALYGEDFDRRLEPAIEMCYRRITLVAKDGGERMTIDSGLMFAGPRECREVDDDAFIVETKSANGNGIADKILRALHQHPVKRCSKYCTAMAALREVARHNKFLPALRKLNLVPTPARARFAGAAA